jgi:hypothetical protein
MSPTTIVRDWRRTVAADLLPRGATDGAAERPGPTPHSATQPHSVGPALAALRDRAQTLSPSSPRPPLPLPKVTSTKCRAVSLGTAGREQSHNLRRRAGPERFNPAAPPIRPTGGTVWCHSLSTGTLGRSSAVPTSSSGGFANVTGRSTPRNWTRYWSGS